MIHSGAETVCDVPSRASFHAEVRNEARRTGGGLIISRVRDWPLFPASPFDSIAITQRSSAYVHSLGDWIFSNVAGMDCGWARLRHLDR
jgi:hypothetical protein